MSRYIVDPIAMAAVDRVIQQAADRAELAAWRDGWADLEEWLDLATLHAVDRWETLRRVQNVSRDAEAQRAMAGPTTTEERT